MTTTRITIATLDSSPRALADLYEPAREMFRWKGATLAVVAGVILLLLAL